MQRTQGIEESCPRPESNDGKNCGSTSGRFAKVSPVKNNSAIPCPCGRHGGYDKCCRIWHGGKAAPDAETLMRSRYSAYVMKLDEYLLRTWHTSTRPSGLDLAKDTLTKWMGLEVCRHQITGANSATVEFIARFKTGGRAQRLQETSRFVRVADRWYYLDGEVQNG